MTTVSTLPPEESQYPGKETKEPEKEAETQAFARKNQNARMLAALQITKQAQILIEQNKPDDAIRNLERAISLNPTDGKNYYYMAEAWVMKKNKKQALEFNRLAEIYLKDNNEWILKVLWQMDRIEMINVD